MKFLIITLSCLLLCACSRELRDDAGETPIGSVFTGESTSTSDYLNKVSEQNRKATQSPWQPKTDGRF